MKRIIFTLLIVLFLAGSVLADQAKFGSIGSGSASVVTPGTAVQLSTTSKGCGMIMVTKVADISHDTGIVYVGDINVYAGGIGATTANLKLRKGVRITSEDIAVFPAADVSMLYVDSVLTEDGVSFVYFY